MNSTVEPGSIDTRSINNMGILYGDTIYSVIYTYDKVNAREIIKSIAIRSAPRVTFTTSINPLFVPK